MKKLLFFVTVLLLSASFSFSQNGTITLGIPDIDLTGYNPGDDVVVPLVCVYKEPGYDIIGFDFFVGFDHTLLTWKGSNPNPLPGIQNINPLLTPYNAGDWIFNDNGSAVVCLWQDPTYLGANLPDGSVFYDYISPTMVD